MDDKVRNDALLGGLRAVEHHYGRGGWQGEVTEPPMLYALIWDSTGVGLDIIPLPMPKIWASCDTPARGLAAATVAMKLIPQIAVPDPDFAGLAVACETWVVEQISKADDENYARKRQLHLHPRRQSARFVHGHLVDGTRGFGQRLESTEVYHDSVDAKIEGTIPAALERLVTVLAKAIEDRTGVTLWPRN